MAKTPGRERVMVYHPEFLEEYLALLEDKDLGLELIPCQTVEEIEQHIGSAEIVFAAVTFPGQCLRGATALRWIQVMGAGVERFIGGHWPPGVKLTRARGLHSELMSEYVIGYALALVKDMRRVFRSASQRQWDFFRVDTLQDKVFGIAGLGVVGRVIARRLRALGARVIAYDEWAQCPPTVERVYRQDELPAFLSQVDFLVIVLPLTEQTRHRFGWDEFSQMKQSAWVMNISRGPIINEAHLIKALEQQVISGAVLDVFQEEPLPATSPLWALNNAIITPHYSGPSLPPQTVDFFVDNLARYRQGKRLSGLVNVKRGF